ncbi:hypothetical protein Q4517_11475 [Tenacibaculum sp. 1_MG-2023]|uniref:DUF7738 domain-containing protein n=1 Tax=Tenacibaculum sp. 1_MG-2023 TaxID=3062653 RepID=UPI0026E1AE72|nr:hypothetical protein [Tenacibaculum sp. 1_MG-2023]MDO6676165.1 hypothetical protein [Tenacibaculum sp. 1_MG-2023]
MKKLFIFFCVIVCAQCKGQTKEVNSIKNQLKHFHNQQHRLEFKEEKLFYNDTLVKLDQNMAYYEAIFGKDYLVNDRGRIIDYKNLPISMNKGIDDQVDNIRIELYYYNQEMLNHKSDNETWGFPPKILGNDYILIDGVPLNKDTDIEIFNKILAKTKKRTFTQKFEGVPAVEREYLSIESPLENIHISFGELSNLDFIMYSDGATTSD